MATYNGPRPIFPGRNSNDNVHHYNGRLEEYSNYSIFNPTQLLEDMPREDHVPGTGRHPHDLYMSRVFRGLEDNTQPIDDVGEGARIEGMRFRPLENKAAGNNKVFKAAYGHEIDTPVRPGGQSYSYSNFKYDGIPEEPLASPGHSIRAVDGEGTANSFGRFNPHLTSDRNVGEDPLEDAGQPLPEDYDNEYGKNKVNEWRGVESTQVLNV